MFTLRRVGTPEKAIACSADPQNNYARALREVRHQLSSPITSYKFKKDLTKKATLTFEHRVT